MQGLGTRDQGSEMTLFDYMDLLGKHFEYGGRGPDAYDCYGLCIELYRRMGIELPHYQSVSDPAEIHCRMADGRLRHITQIDRPEPGCFVMFSIRPPFVSHIGIVLEDCNRFIHIMQKSSVTVERLDSVLWEKKIAGFYNLKNHG
jgi:murein DD-endopeptidase